MEATTFTLTTKNVLKEVLTYDLIMRKISEQNRLVAEDKIKKPKPVEGFNAKDWIEYENGTPIEEYARKRGVAL